MRNYFAFAIIFCMLTHIAYAKEGNIKEKEKKETEKVEIPVPLHGKNFVQDAAGDYNRLQVAKQFDSITSPTESQAKFINRTENLALTHIQAELSQATGLQHSADLFLTQIVNTRFIRRMYDPLRRLATKDICNIEWYDIQEKECNYPIGFDFWAEVGGSRLSQKNDDDDYGFSMDGFQTTVGIQKSFFNALTLGLAGSYEYDHVHYKIRATGNMNSVLAGAYGLYKFQRGYILGDIAYGYSGNKLRRYLGFKPENFVIHSYPKVYQLTYYAEAGIDFAWEDLMIQPFIGVETGRFQSNKVNETGGGDFDLTVQARKRTLTSTRVGLHLTSDTLPTNLAVSLDLAWNYRCTTHKNIVSEHFATFGEEFFVSGIPLSRNYFDGAITVTKKIFPYLDCFGQFSGEMWESSSAYSALLGVDYRW